MAQLRSPRLRPRLRGTPGPPHFVGVGGFGGRGRWWMAQLAAHPQIRPPRDRRVTTSAFTGSWATPLDDAAIAAYHGRFAHRPGVRCGEWTGTYMSEPWTPPLLARVAPDARLLAILEDPIEAYRALFAERLARRAAGERQVWMSTAFTYHQYASQLAALERCFAPDRIQVLQYEACRADPAGQYRRTLQFLGVDEVLPRRFAVPEPRPLPELWPELEHALRVALAPEVRALVTARPEVDLTLWPNFAP